MQQPQPTILAESKCGPRYSTDSFPLLAARLKKLRNASRSVIGNDSFRRKVALAVAKNSCNKRKLVLLVQRFHMYPLVLSIPCQLGL